MTTPQPEETPKPAVIKQSAIVLIVTLVALTVIFFAASKYFHKTPQNKPDFTYNYFEFKKIEGMWHTKWQRDGQLFDVSLRYSPLEVERILVGGALNKTWLQQPYYLTFDPDSNSSNSSNNTDFKYLALAFSELGLNWARGMGNQVITACTKNLTGVCAGHPIVTCDDDDKAVFYVRIAEKPHVTLDGNCLIIEGRELELIKAVDRVLYHFYGIMP
ncbi:MAG: hypothetical protein QXR48_01485 [Candidatus Woesearchaeota archaeon]